MRSLTPIQQKIIECLPATAEELAQALYGRATRDERNLVHVHIYHLRRRLNGRGHIVTRRRQRDDPSSGSSTGFDASPCRVVYELNTTERSTTG